MLGKVIKNEFKATYGIYLIVLMALFLVTVAEKITQYVKIDNKVWTVLSFLLTVAFFLFVIFVSLGAQIVSVVRFYKTMTKDQGYLTHTIPVEKGTIILGKAICSCVWVFASIVASGVAVLIYGIGSDWLGEGFNIVGECLKVVVKEPIYIFWAVLGIVIFVVALLASIMQYYCAVSLGQMFATHKIAGAVLFYFVIYYATNFAVSAIVIGIPSIAGVLNATFGIDIFSWNGNVLTTITIFGYLVIMLIYYFVCFGITKRRFTKRFDIQ